MPSVKFGASFQNLLWHGHTRAAPGPSQQGWNCTELALWQLAFSTNVSQTHCRCFRQLNLLQKHILLGHQGVVDRHQPPPVTDSEDIPTCTPYIHAEFAV